MAWDIALIEPEPMDWAVWVSYLLEQMDSEAQKRRKDAAYKSMLLDLQNAIKTLIEGGRW